MVPPGVVKLVHTPYCTRYDLVPVRSHQAIYQVEIQQYGFVPEAVLQRSESTPRTDSARIADDALRWDLPNDGALQPPPSLAVSAPEQEQPESVGPSLAGSLQDSLQGANDQDRNGSRGLAFLPQHDYLMGKVECLKLTAQCRIRQPSTAAPPPESPSAPHKLFAGHITFEVTAPQLRWIVFTLTGGVLCGKIEPRGPGCYVIFLQSEEEAEAVMRLHRRVLFDYGCLWFGRTPEEEQVLQSYATAFPQRPSRLPKGLMIVEEEVSGSRKRRRRPKKAGQAETQMQQQIQLPSAIGEESLLES